MPTYKIHDDGSDEWISLAQGPRGFQGEPGDFGDVGGTAVVGYIPTVTDDDPLTVEWAEPHLLTSPNSTVYRIVVDNDGNLSTEAV
jgi:hypothetical protein